MAGRAIHHRRAVTTIIQFLAGVGGLFLDIFFQKSTLDRKTTNATKAVAQTFSHMCCARSISARSSGIDELRADAVGARDPAGDHRHLLSPSRDRAHERRTAFRQWTCAIIFAISLLYLARAAWHSGTRCCTTESVMDPG